MRNFTQILLLCAIAITSYGQKTFNMELVAEVDNGETGNDIWGYVDSTGVEYAIMGTRTTTKIWSLEDPTNPIERASIPGPAGTWRDIKSFEDHLYVTSDQGDQGLLIIDMSGAPETITSEYWKPLLVMDTVINMSETSVINFDTSIINIDTFIVTVDTIAMTMDTITTIIDTSFIPIDTTIVVVMDTLKESLNQCHNLYIDTDQGFMYLADCNRKKDVLILDLNQDKKIPVHISTIELDRTHDVYVKNDKIYVSDLEFGFRVYDATDKVNPVLLGGEVSSFNFTHNAWVSDDENYIFTTDERRNAFVESFDISDLDNIIPLDRFQSLESQGEDVIPHNTHYLNGFLITSWYADGVVINDVNKPDNIIKVGAFDSESIASAGFVGSWGAYPYLPSGLILATDGPELSEKLKIFRPVDNNGDMGYQRASYLEGTVTDINTGAFIPNVEVNIISSVENLKRSNSVGQYKTGLALPGVYEVMFSHPNYESVIGSVELISGEVTILDVQMGNSLISGRVQDVTTGDPVPDAQVVLLDLENNSTISAVTDSDGSWSTGVRDGAAYALQVAKWGYIGATQDFTAQPDGLYNTELDRGYQDDFFADLGWSVSGDASSGQWEIGAPSRLADSGELTQTDEDIEGDIGTTYYVTGASGGSIGENDIDNGSVILTSPMMNFADSINRIDISYHLWFSNVGGSGAPNDEVTVEIINGTSTFVLPTKTESSGEWSDLIEVTVSDTDIEFNDQMQIIVTATDDDPGHVVEAGIDVFNAFGYMTTNTQDLSIENLGLTVFPNPTSDYIYLNSSKLLEGNNIMRVTDNMGKIVMTKFVSSTTERYNVESLSTGIYNVQVVGENKQSETIRIVKN